MLSELLEKAQINNDREALAEILESFSPKIKASLRQVPIDFREDLKQDLYVTMIEVIRRFDLN